MFLTKLRRLTYQARVTLTVTVCSIGIAACGGAGAKSAVSPSTTAASAPHSNASPSAATKMICGPEGQHEIARAIGATPVRPVTPTWRSRRYSCNDVYRDGTLALAVEQSTTVDNARAYYGQLTKRSAHDLAGLGASAASLPDATVIVRKDNDILIVDARRLPARFGQPPDTPNNIALTVAATIMGCWTES